MKNLHKQNHFLSAKQVGRRPTRSTETFGSAQFEHILFTIGISGTFTYYNQWSLRQADSNNDQLINY